MLCHRKFLLMFLMLIACSPVAAHAASKTHSGTVTVAVDLTAQENGQEAELWLPYPISDREQTITEVKISGDFSQSAVYAENANSTPMLYAKWDRGATSRKLTFSFKALRKEVIRRNFPAKETAWDPADYQDFLQGTNLAPLDGATLKLAGKITAGKNSVLEKARAIYDWTCENTYRDPKTRGCGDGKVCNLLLNPGGKCVDIHSLFVALARAAGVPSREVFGIRLGKNDKDDSTTWQHCWAEFFLPGYGWVPVDPADVRKAMLKENLTLEDAKTKEYREYFWGGIDPYRVTLSTGRDLILNPPHPGAPVNYFMYPFARVGDRILDWLDPATFSYTITYSAK
ncbi:MAG: transglutaminase-like domain-containing protein [Geobacteraceae bacterium]|nr:transglutaminase-like domain-containing protein [Geobacteraceae bacterium]